MMEWWNKKGWPWLKENWWKVLIFPVGLVLAAIALLSRGKKGDVEELGADPLREADRRAEEEQITRRHLIVKENERLREELARIEREREEAMKNLSEEQRSRYEELKEDPDALNAWLLSIQNRQR